MQRGRWYFVTHTVFIILIGLCIVGLAWIRLGPKLLNRTLTINVDKRDVQSRSVGYDLLINRKKIGAFTLTLAHPAQVYTIPRFAEIKIAVDRGWKGIRTFSHGDITIRISPKSQP